MTDSQRLELALSAIDAANADDPNRIEIDGEVRPKELAHAELASAWVEKLCDAPSDALRIAARAHHVRRWEIPRSAHPQGRRGYLAWRRELQGLHARVARECLKTVGVAEETIRRVEELVCKRGLGRDPEVQVLEDALCLVFLETQLRDLAQRLDPEKMVEVTRKTLRKMSPAATLLAGSVPLEPEMRAVLDRAGSR